MRLMRMVMAMPVALLLGAGLQLAEARAEAPLSTAIARALPEEQFPPLPVAKRDPSSRFLIATHQVQGRFFARSVVLLIQHDRRGAMGLILNRPSTTQVAALLPEQEEKTPRKDTLYVGGPVDPGQIVFLVRTEDPPPGAIHVLPDVYATSDSEILRKFAKGDLPVARFRAYVGYAGWGPGQLKGEIARGDWFSDPAKAETIFDPKPQNMWERLVAEHEGVQVRVHEKPGEKPPTG
ncbi:MAG: hypothetical protein CL938_15425 [Deltaproteobacteria bacterium]|nr:hypothetical protein [Deltaproteobacteria bacterium]